MKESCESCRYYAKGKSECHRMPPVPFLVQQKDESGIERPGAVTLFPPIDPTGWCGEYKFKPSLTIDAEIA